MHDDFDACYRALQSRDPRFDGLFVTGVTSTGIYCRPVCPAQTPQRANVRFYRNAAAAEAAGFRACLRCRPNGAGAAVPALGGDLATRALRLIAAGVADGADGVGAVARRLDVSDRHLHRVLVQAVGVGPLALARTRRLLAARALVVETSMAITDVALTAGYSSLRQFNSEVRSGTGLSPTELRARGAVRLPGEGAIVLRLAVRAPFDGTALLDFVARRAVAGVERVDTVRLCRSVALEHGAAVVELEPGVESVTARLWLDDIRDLGAAVDRCRHLLDADSDPAAIGAALSCDPLLAPLVRFSPGLRVPGALDGDEVALRAVLGQQVTVQRATALACTLARRLGTVLRRPHRGVERVFPSAAAVATGDLAGLGLTAERTALTSAWSAWPAPAVGPSKASS